MDLVALMIIEQHVFEHFDLGLELSFVRRILVTVDTILMIPEFLPLLLLLRLEVFDCSKKTLSFTL
jgi:hypothetical protein